MASPTGGCPIQRTSDVVSALQRRAKLGQALQQNEESGSPLSQPHLSHSTSFLLLFQGEKTHLHPSDLPVRPLSRCGVW